jgi:hypothetical protein
LPYAHIDFVDSYFHYFFAIRITLNGKTNEKKNGKVDEIEHDITKESEKVIGDTEEDKMLLMMRKEK